MCATLTTTSEEKERFQLTLLDIEKSIEKGNQILKRMITQKESKPKKNNYGSNHT